MNQTYTYLIGVDGGGTNTRVAIALSDQPDKIISRAQGAACALGQGRQKAWRKILETIHLAFEQKQMALPELSKCAIALGLSGVNNKIWAQEFRDLNPGFGFLSLNTDAYTTLMGASPNGQGIVVALGTGSVGIKRNAQGSIQTVSGWGYPAGDEASGAWLGLKVASYIQKVFDHREQKNILFELIQKSFAWQNTDDFLEWLGRACQHEFAQLAPFVFQAKKQGDDYALKLVNHTLFEMHKMLDALDPTKSETFCLCGGIGQALIEELDPTTLSRHKNAQGDGVQGALNILKEGIK